MRFTIRHQFPSVGVQTLFFNEAAGHAKIWDYLYPHINFLLVLHLDLVFRKQYVVKHAAPEWWLVTMTDRIVHITHGHFVLHSWWTFSKRLQVVYSANFRFDYHVFECNKVHKNPVCDLRGTKGWMLYKLIHYAGCTCTANSCDLIQHDSFHRTLYLWVGYKIVVACPAQACLLARNGLVNQVEFLGLITQKW